MKRINRLKSITKARIEAFLGSLEKPEIIFPQLLKELADKVAEAGKAEAKALSAVKADRRRLDAAIGKAKRFEEGSQLAVKAGDIQTARQAIAAQIKAEKEQSQVRGSLEFSESAYNSAKSARQQLQQNLEELKLKKDQIIARAKSVENKKAVNDVVRGTESILDAVARMESKVEECEDQIESQSEIAQTLGAGFTYERARELESNAEVDRRLNEIKKKILSDEPGI